MESRWTPFDSWGNRLSILTTVVALMTGAFGWLSGHAGWFGSNWAADILIGFMFASALVLVFSAGTIAWTYRGQTRKPNTHSDFTGFAESILPREPMEKQVHALRDQVQKQQKAFDKLRADFAALSERTQFPQNLGQTLGDALEEIQAALRSQVDRADVTEKVKWIGLDVKHLLSLACSLSSATALKKLKSERPENIDPADISEQTVDSRLKHISAAEVVLIALGRYQDFQHIMSNAEKMADDYLGNLPTPEYPSGITPAVYRKRMIVREQFVVLAAYLDKELNSVRKAMIDARARMIEGLTRD